MHLKKFRIIFVFIPFIFMFHRKAVNLRVLLHNINL